MTAQDEDFPTVARLAARTTFVFGILFTMFVALIIWISATTGDPITLYANEFGEAWVEAVFLAVVVGISAYGTAVLDWYFR